MKDGSVAYTLSWLLSGVLIGLLIMIAVALLLWGLSIWEQRCRRLGHRWLLHRNMPQYPTISRADLDVEAAATEAKYYDLPEYRRHRNKV